MCREIAIKYLLTMTIPENLTPPIKVSFNPPGDDLVRTSKQELQKGVAMLPSESQMWRLVLGIQALGDKGRIAHDLEASRNYVMNVRESCLLCETSF